MTKEVQQDIEHLKVKLEATNDPVAFDRISRQIELLEEALVLTNQSND